MAPTFDDDYTTDMDLLKNPERGMYYDKPLEPDNDDYDTSWIVAEWLWLAPWCHEDLVWDRNQPELTSQVLKDYAKKLEDARSDGYKILFRPRYDKEPGGKASDDCMINGVPVFHADSRKRQFNHIDAVAEMLGDYKDVIAYIQAGYLGNWGEWNTAGKDEDDNDYKPENAPLLYNRTDRSDIIDRVLSAYAAKGIAQDVELRRPVFAKEVVERWEHNPDIYNNASPNVGLHNDCFMSSDNRPGGNNSDSGTYSDFFDFTGGSPQNFGDEVAAREWAEDWTEHSSFGGETCPSNNHPGHERWQFCDSMTSSTGDPENPPGDPEKLHLCYLNAERSNTVSRWTAQGCYKEIRLKIGYRFEVKSVEYTKYVRVGGAFSVAVDVENTGWARLHKPREAKLVLHTERPRPWWWLGPWPPEYTFSGGPVSKWAPGTTTRISASHLPWLPLPRGTYSVWLKIPDPDLPKPEENYPAAKINYAVKLATLRGGTNVFRSDTAANDLGVEITVYGRPRVWPWEPPPRPVQDWPARRAR